MVEVLGAYPARPPTPPKASHNLFKRDAGIVPGRPNMLNTPGESPSSTAESTILRSNKKVNFSPITNYIKPPTFSSRASMSSNEVRPIPPSNECKPAKSILKTPAADIVPLEKNEPQSFAVLLESATQQLAGESLSSRIDAYMQLLGALKAYDNITEQDDMSSKVGVLLQFVQRDISRDLGKRDVVETNLVTNALKMGIYIIWSQPLASQIPDDFKIFIIDHALSVLQDGKLSKAILNHYVHVLYTQNFSAKIMTNSRITRVLVVLNDITDRVNGNGIISQRLGVYTRLLGQSKATMASQASLWVEHLISGLLHPVKDTRSKALVLGTQTALLLGPNLVISKTILDIFNKEISQGRKLVSEVCDRMSRMMSPSDSGVHVPQIWSIIVLLLRSKRFNIEHWEYFKEWVLVLQRCFNCSDPAIKSQAIVGWNKFVYMVTCNESTSRSMLKMLTKPILSNFERKRSDKAGASVNPLFLSSYYNLLYYSFRPNNTFDHIDFIWEEYFSQPFVNVFASNPQLNDAACKALASLLWTSQSKIWTEDKIHEVPKMEANFILPIDCRWVRSRIVPVVAAFEVLVASANWTNIQMIWIHICKALSDASSKEIKPSSELMQAIATILGLFQRLRQASPSSLNAETDDVFIERFTYLATTLVSTVGPSPFTETLLLKTSQETFQAANTPTHRRPRTDRNSDTPFMHILRMISSYGNTSEPTKSLLSLIDGLLDAASKGRQARGSRLDFLERCTELSIDENGEYETTSKLVSYIWDATARYTVICLGSLPMETLRERDGTISRDYINISNILLRGLQLRTSPPTWSALLESYIRIIRTEKGERGISTLVIEPITQRLLQIDYVRAYLPTKALINQALSLAYYEQNKYPATPSSSSQPSSFSFPDKLLDLIRKVLADSYNHFNASDSVVLAEVVESLTSLLGSGTLQFRHMLLESLQTPLALWLRDSARFLTSEKGADNRLLTAYRTLSLAIANAMQIAVPHNTASLHAFEAVVSAGLESVHKSTANRFIEMWNVTFGLQELANYPSGVQSALQKLEPLVKLQLPLPLPRQAKSQNIHGICQVLEMPDFVESQDTTSFEPVTNTFGRVLRQMDSHKTRPTTFSSSPIIQSTEWAQPHVLPQQNIDSTPRKRLRHDNSQIQFVTVDPSPRASNMESQLLTERQQEVRERQRGSTSMFLDGLGSSSPAPALTEVPATLSPVRLPKIRDTVREPEAPSTPTLAAHLQDNDDDFPGSSPTPGTREQGHLASQGNHALTIETFGNIQSDPPSSPPEISRSPSSKRLSSQKPTPEKSKVEASEKQNSRRRRSSRITEHKAPGESTVAPIPSAKETNTPQQSDIEAQEEPTLTSEVTDVIPDTYADEFEQQLASQLEQDLELAVDLKDQDDIESIQSSDVNLPRGPITRKRKRNAETEEASTPERVKRRQSKKSKAARSERARTESSQSDSDTMKPSTPETLNARRGLSTPQSSPLKNQISVDDLSDKSTNSESKRRSGRLNVPADREILSSPIKSRRSRSRKRRSLRLSGVPALSPPKSDKTSKAQKRKRTKSRNQNDDEAAEADIQDNSMQDVKMPDGETGTSNQNGESTEAQAAPAPETTDVQTDTVVESAVDAAISTSAGNETEEQAVENDIVMEEASPEMSIAAPTSTIMDEAPRYISQGVQTDDVMDISESNTDSAQTGGSILGSLRRVLTGIKNVTFGRNVLKEIDDVMFDIRVEAHEAARRDQA
ncbi:telomere length regulator protein (Rif1), putative [Talaromyces stipitatus ATCC 10500]|uniref:Telomere length regulator protein (Rif1), putative n=1 Tax=Talaromyces stipitatus (strain ATCC 10500 / CBS 375.48 / QM 6759 / NRRL 1006) TaxID=441959 RepID=B8ME46_TALSN|nr:telomere length regulator protein (Rif1), putative [Talaromyces stipitatus ATCC 10500]EED16473.1 telomere length regulator protein (Rif1), putative [Talaromyces stipitatus ATCC 10500]